MSGAGHSGACCDPQLAAVMACKRLLEGHQHREPQCNPTTVPNPCPCLRRQEVANLQQKRESGLKQMDYMAGMLMGHLAQRCCSKLCCPCATARLPTFLIRMTIMTARPHRLVKHFKVQQSTMHMRRLQGPHAPPQDLARLVQASRGPQKGEGGACKIWFGDGKTRG